MGGGGEYGVLGLRQVYTCRKVPLQVIFLDEEILQNKYEGRGEGAQLIWHIA